MCFERNGTNLIYEDETQNGKLLSDYERTWFDPDGGRFDYGPEKKTAKIHNLSYMGPYSAEIIDGLSLKITSEYDYELGLQTQRFFRLDPGSGRVSIVQTMKNISASIKEYFFWGRTLVKSGGILFTTLNPDSIHPAKWGRYIWGEPLNFKNDPHDRGVETRNGLFALSTTELTNEKYGVDSIDGWMAYAYKGLLLIKSYRHFDLERYGEDFGLKNIFYVKKGVFAEMEPVSPMKKLNPGEEYSYAEDWILLEYLPAGEVEFEAHLAADYIKREIEKGRF